MDELSYEEYVRAHNLPPLVPVKKACEIANVGHTRFYELVEQGVFTLIPNGSRRNVTAQNLHRYYLALIGGASRTLAHRSVEPSNGVGAPHTLGRDTAA